MAQGLFINFTLSEVQAILAKAKALVLEGKTIMSYGNEGTSATKQFTMDPKTVLEECNYALRVLNPAQYGNVKKTRRVHSNYNVRSGL